jgi:hypothetical protein
VTPVRARRKLVSALALAVAAVLLSLTACNSSESGDSSQDTNDPEQAALDFAQCMRDNGVASFPDPVAKPDGSFGFARPKGVPRSALDNALESCQSEARKAGIDALAAAQDPEAQDQLLEFSRCMRANGVPDFPDPKPSGSDSLRSIFGEVDLQSPPVQKAMESCDSILRQLGAPFSGGSG